jgi:hypothetical protein
MKTNSKWLMKLTKISEASLTNVWFLIKHKENQLKKSKIIFMNCVENAT